MMIVRFIGVMERGRRYGEKRTFLNCVRSPSADVSLPRKQKDKCELMLEAIPPLHPPLVLSEKRIHEQSMFSRFPDRAFFGAALVRYPIIRLENYGSVKYSKYERRIILCQRKMNLFRMNYH